MSLFICLISGLFWSFFDLTRKLCLKKISSEFLLLIFSFCQIIIFGVWCLFQFPTLLINDYIWFGSFLLLINVISAVVFLKSLDLSEISMTLPLLSFSPLFSAFFSFYLLSEKITSYQYLGVFLIIFGTMTLYTKSFKLTDFFFSLNLIFSEKGARYMLFVSLIWSVTPIFDKLCFKYASFNIHGLIQALGMYILLLIYVFKRQQNLLNIRLLKDNFKLFSFTMFVGSVATILQFIAISISLVPIMESIKRAVGQIGAVFYGKYIFSEVINFKKIFGILIITFGTFFVLLF